MVNKDRMCCPVGFSKEFNAVSYLKMSQIKADLDKKRKFFIFHCFYAFFVTVSTAFVNWNVEKGRKGKNV